MNHSQSLALIGDIGGTNARFALADLAAPPPCAISHVTHLPSARFATLELALHHYLALVPASPRIAVLALAGPVAGGQALLTNLGWHAREADLRGLGFSAARLVNDFQALAAAADALTPPDLQRIGPPLPGLADGVVAVAGAGTGFGVAALQRGGGRSIALASEGGHIGFSPEDALESEIFHLLRARFGRVSLERIVSGPGLVNLYQALCQIDGVPADRATAPEIVSANDPKACLAVERFCAIFGAAAGDIALAFNARGGVLLAGGLSEALAERLQASQFRARFERKGRLAHVAEAIPTHLITRPDAALLGCARLAADLARS